MNSQMADSPPLTKSDKVVVVVIWGGEYAL